MGRIKAAVKRLLPPAVLSWVRSAPERLRYSIHCYRSGVIGLAKFGGHDMAYRLGTMDVSVLRHSFDHDIFLTAIPEYTLPANAIVLDIGAHIGTFSILAATKARQGRIFALEPSLGTYSLLTVNVAINRLQNIVSEHLALTDRVGLVELYHDPEDHYGHSVMKQLSTSKETVPATTLARYLEEKGLDYVDLAKFNCEGAEFAILQSSSPEVLNRIGKMIVLYHCDLVEGANLSQLVGHLRGSGFETRLINQTRQRGWIIATRAHAVDQPDVPEVASAIGGRELTA